VTESEARIAVLKSDIAELDKRLALLAFWVKGFGNSGIKSFLIESELAELNRRCSTYAARLFGGGVKIWVTATRELKTGALREEVTFHVDIPKCADNYYGCSAGQKRRVDLVILLALRDLVSSRVAARCSQLFVDEVFDGIDAAGVDAVCELLKELSSVGPVMLVTHTDGLRRAADRVVTVTHHGSHATLAVA
jgi:DNA repair exonuclease SbcCD ATPase subunit